MWKINQLSGIVRVFDQFNDSKGTPEIIFLFFKINISADGGKLNDVTR